MRHLGIVIKKSSLEHKELNYQIKILEEAVQTLLCSEKMRRTDFTPILKKTFFCYLQ